MEVAEQTPIIAVLGVVVGLGLLTFLVITTTSFVKVAVVLFIVRNALGLQQAPPNIVLYGIALSLTAFICAPLATEMSEAVLAGDPAFRSFDDYRAAFDRGVEPLRAFLIRLTAPESREFFLAASGELWPEDREQPFTDEDVAVLIPAFLMAELQRAFEIGFLLYLPLVVVDLVVTSVLMAMGMTMVSPPIIATPVKLFLFVAISGWTRLLEGLVLSYA